MAEATKARSNWAARRATGWRAIAALLWLAVLLLTVPASGSFWQTGSIAFEVSALAAHPVVAAYLAGAVILCGLFTLYCRARRRVLAMFAAVLGAIWLGTEAIGFDRILLSVAAPAVLTVLVGAFRRNRPL